MLSRTGRQARKWYFFLNNRSERLAAGTATDEIAGKLIEFDTGPTLERSRRRMDKIIFITPGFAVSSALTAADFAMAARLGFRTVLSNRPDGEEAGQMTARDGAVHAWRAGLRFAHVPSSKLDVLTDAVVEAMADAVRRLDGPILAHCSSGVRSAIIWAAASARNQPVECVLDALAKAGFDLAFLRDDLEAQADRRRWLGDDRAAMDCGSAAVVTLPARTA